MTIDELKELVSAVLDFPEPHNEDQRYSPDECDHLNAIKRMWESRQEIIALIEAFDLDATHINDGSDPMGGWLGQDEYDKVWAAFIALKKKLDKM